MINKSKLNKNIRKVRSIILKNKDNIKMIVVSKELMEKFLKAPKWVDLTVKEDKETEAENWFLYEIPFRMSEALKAGCVLEMKSGEYVILNKI